MPLPDAECRHRLFEFYGRGLTLQVESWDRLVQHTEGASAAFIRELMRRATLLALDEQAEAAGDACAAGSSGWAISDRRGRSSCRIARRPTLAHGPARKHGAEWFVVKPFGTRIS